MVPPKNRLKKLLEQARLMAGKRRRTVRLLQCQGLTWVEMLDKVFAAVLPESNQVMEDLLRQIEAYEQQPPRELANGHPACNVHGFIHWLQSLQSGSSSLPSPIPHALLLAWRNGTINHPARGTPVPVRRCEDCLLILPNCTVNEFGPCLSPCPACGSGNLSWKTLYGNEITGWDLPWIYTPLPPPGRKPTNGTH